MTSGNINSFVGDLVEMAKAMERLPSVEAENNRLNGEVERYAKQVQDREIAIIAYKEHIDDLNAKVRSLEVERDDASFRVLEAEDQAHTILDKARGMQTILEVILATLDPPKPEPVKEPEPQAQPVATPAEGQSVVDPTFVAAAPESGSVSASATQSENATTTTIAPDWKQDQAETSILPPGQSESSPTPAYIPEVVGNSSGQDTATHLDTVSASEPTHGPYFGKRYHDTNEFIPLWKWIDGGGTEADYYWRPEHHTNW